MNTYNLTLVADCQNECGESPLWDPKTEALYWTDCSSGRFFEYVLATRRHRVVKTGLQINRCLLANNGFVITNNDGLWKWDGVDKLELVANRAGEVPLQLNDATTDSRGRVFAGTCFFSAEAHYPLGHLVRIDNDGSAHILDEGFHLANGLAFSPDERTLYFADSVARRIYAYDFDISQGNISNRRIFVEIPRNEGLPDGMAIDTDGFLWSAQWYGSSVVRYDPGGKVHEMIRVPAKQVSSVAFGGANLAELFITTAGMPEPMLVMPFGYDPFLGEIGGPLYSIQTASHGVRQQLANLR